MTDLVQSTIKNQVGIITLNNPEKRNALSPILIAGLQNAFEAMIADPLVRVIQLQANGKAFCAGADLDYIQTLQNFTYEENLVDSNKLKSLFLTIYRSPKPVIAKIQGHALAGGCGLASICDFSFSIPEANFGYTEVKIGFIPALVMVFLINKIGEGRSRELLLSGELITANYAQSIGLINYVIEAEEIDQKVDAFTQRLIETNSPQSMQTTKFLLEHLPNFPLSQALEEAAQANAKARGTEDCVKGIAAFLSKSKPIW